LFGINLGNQLPAEEMVAVARHAEAAGLESVWVGEHVAVPMHVDSRYPYNRTGEFQPGTDTPFVDPLITLAHLAAATTTLRLGTGIMIVPQWNPLLLAKQVASLDVVAGGRLLLGLGLGWMAEEFRLMGAPFEHRGARFADYVAAMRKVWGGGVVEHHSEFLDWAPFKSLPLPRQQPHPPIIIGGHSRAAVRRAVTLGDGLFPFTRNVAAMADVMQLLHAECEAQGRDPATIEVTTLWNFGREGAASVPRYAELGVSRLVAFPQAMGEGDIRARIDRFAAAANAG
jgi:probable F420-dependent oxidoreductase